MTKEKFEIDLTSFKKFKGPKELYEITGVDCSYNDQSKKGLLLKLKVYKIVKFREFEIFLIFFARKNFRESAFKEFFAELTFANLTKIRENRESSLPRKFVPLKYATVFSVDIRNQKYSNIDSQ